MTFNVYINKLKIIMAASCSSSDFQEVTNTMDSNTDSEAEGEQIEMPKFEFLNRMSCWVCNGYYGPNFEEPICGTCHAFLYPTNCQERLITMVHDDEEEDSGNDEPPFTALDKERQEREEPSVSDHFNSENEDQMENNRKYFSLQRPAPSPPRTLSKYLEMLSLPRNQESCDKCIMMLPVEVLVHIFSHLDDISLWNVSQVCKQWKNILQIHTTPALWRKAVKERWPLFRNLVDIPDWFQMYSALMTSCSCRTCLLQMALKSPPGQRESAIRINRLRIEFRTLNVDPSEGIEAVPLDKQCSNWQASILGPSGSPYEGGKFFLYVFFPDLYPMLPPKVRFLTKILHPNVSRHGDVGIDIIQHNWSLALTVSKILLSVQSLLTDPFTEICMEPELGDLYERNRPAFEGIARLWTWQYAMLELIPPRD